MEQEIGNQDLGIGNDIFTGGNSNKKIIKAVKVIKVFSIAINVNYC